MNKWTGNNNRISSFHIVHSLSILCTIPYEYMHLSTAHDRFLSRVNWTTTAIFQDINNDVIQYDMNEIVKTKKIIKTNTFCMMRTPFLLIRHNLMATKFVCFVLLRFCRKIYFSFCRKWMGHMKTVIQFIHCSKVFVNKQCSNCHHNCQCLLMFFFFSFFSSIHSMCNKANCLKSNSLCCK